MNVETVIAERYPVGECPTWDDRTQRLLWTSITEGTIHALDPATSRRERWTFDSVVGSFGLCDSGRLVVALKDSVVLFDPATGKVEPLARIEHPIAQMRLNDGKVGPDGAFWIGSMDERTEREPIGALYRVTAAGDVTRVVSGFKVANGLAWSPDGRTIYFSDSHGPWIDRCDFDAATGRLDNRTRFATLTNQTGRPDGGACDVDGHYWSAGPSASRINRFARDGSIAEFFPMPTVRPTMPGFGGADMKTVYVTSLSQNVPADLLAANPLCGGIVSFRAEIAGAPVARFPA